MYSYVKIIKIINKNYFKKYFLKAGEVYTYVNFQPEILNSELVNSETSLTLFITHNVSGSARVSIVPVFVPVLANLHGQVLLTLRHRTPRLGSNQQSPFVQVTILKLASKIRQRFFKLLKT